MAPRRSEVRLLFCRLNAGHVLVLTMREHLVFSHRPRRRRQVDLDERTPELKLLIDLVLSPAFDLQDWEPRLAVRTIALALVYKIRRLTACLLIDSGLGGGLGGGGRACSVAKVRYAFLVRCHLTPFRPHE